MIPSKILPRLSKLSFWSRSPDLRDPTEDLSTRVKTVTYSTPCKPILTGAAVSSRSAAEPRSSALGTSLLLVFPAESASQAVMALMELKTKGDAWQEQKRIPCQHQIKAHLGPVVVGPIGASGHEHLDIYGKTVNVCATLENGPLVLTPQVFRAQDADTMRHFKKHAPSVTYYQIEDGH